MGLIGVLKRTKGKGLICELKRTGEREQEQKQELAPSLFPKK
jgi:hypothetical protein